MAYIYVVKESQFIYLIESKQFLPWILHFKRV